MDVEGLLVRPEDMPLALLVPRAGAALARCHQAAAAIHGLTSTALGVLGVLAHRDGLSHRELAGRLGVTPATLTPVMDELEAMGAVQRSRDRGDRRVVRVRLTDDGRERVRTAAAAVRDRLRHQLPHPAPADEAVIRRYLVAVLVAAAVDGS